MVITNKFVKMVLSEWYKKRENEHKTYFNQNYVVSAYCQYMDRCNEKWSAKRNETNFSGKGWQSDMGEYFALGSGERETQGQVPAW